MLQTRNSRWTAATGLVCVLILVAAWFLLVGPRRADAADLRDQRVQAAQSNDALELQIAQLKAQFADLPARQAELASVRTQLPSKAELPKLIRDIDRLTRSSGVELDSLAPAAPTAVTPAAGSVATPNTLFAIPITITAHGDYFEAAQFLRLVQTSMPRAFLVTGLTVDRAEDAGETNGTVKLTVAGQIYVLLDSPASSAGAVQAPAPNAASGTSTGTGSTQPSPGATPTPTTSASTN